MPQVNGQDGVSRDQGPKKVKHGVWGQSDTGYGVVGTSDGYSGVYGNSEVDVGVSGIGGYVGVSGIGSSASGDGVWGRGLKGVRGYGDQTGVLAVGNYSPDHQRSGVGVQAYGGYNFGVYADGSFGLAGLGGNVGIYAHNYNTANGHDAYLSTPNGAGEFYGDVAVYGKSWVAGTSEFWGDVSVFGHLNKPGGGFQIDHPLDPANKYLSHSFVESEDMKNIYDGVATLDNNGKAEVELPNWFQGLNKDFRYQLTPIGSAGPNLHIQQGITKNRFKIAGGRQGMKVSWQVTAIRKDPWANANRIRVEKEKPRKERGYYLQPHLYNKSQQRGIMWARHSEQYKIGRDTMKKTKELLKNIPKAPERTLRTQKRTK